MESLKSRTEKGIKWSAIDQIFRLFITIGISAFLARFISPADFGLFAMVNVVVGFLSIFKDFGLGNAIIYKTDISDDEINNIFWVNNGIAFFLGLVLFFASPYIADFYNEGKLTKLTQAMAVLFMLGSLSSIPDALVRKNIDFKILFTRNIINLVISGIVAMICAYKGMGVWALIVQLYISLIAGVYLNFRMVSWRPKWKKPEWHILKPFLSYSLPLFGENTINYWVRNIDNLLIGKWLNEQTLGYYSRSYNLMLLPVRQISSAVMRVVFPAFSIIKDNKKKVWENYKKLLNITAFITFPLMALMYLLGEEIIYTVYGVNWSASIPIFKGLCLLGAFQSLGTYCGSIFSSQGKTFLQFKLGLFLKPFMIAGIVIGLYFKGIMGLIYGYTITSMIAFLIESFFVMLVLEQKFILFFDGFIKEFLITTIVFFSLFFLKPYLMTGFTLINLVTVTSVFLLFYLLLCKWRNVEGYKFLKTKLK